VPAIVVRRLVLQQFVPAEVTYLKDQVDSANKKDAFEKNFELHLSNRR
jgi:hypothetical protein